MSAEMVYLGLGSNLGDREAYLCQALHALAATPGLTLSCYSSLYVSAPWGKEDQDDFYNAVVALSCTLTPQQLLTCAQAIEKAAGRVRLEHWGARVLDVDILAYGQQQIHDPTLIIPHPYIAQRAFVLRPLAEIAPMLYLPGLGVVAQLWQECPDPLPVSLLRPAEQWGLVKGNTP